MAGFVRKVLLGLVLEDAVIREENAYRFYESALDRASAGEVRQLYTLLRGRVPAHLQQSRNG